MAFADLHFTKQEMIQSIDISAGPTYFLFNSYIGKLRILLYPIIQNNTLIKQKSSFSKTRGGTVRL